jgi:hypothetical protein
MNVLFLSYYFPQKEGGPTALLFSILNSIPEGHSVDYAVLNEDAPNSCIPERVHFIPWSNLSVRTKKHFSLIPKSIDLRKNFRDHYIDVDKYDAIVFYTYNLSLIHLINNHAKIYTIGMDSAPMLYLRGFLSHRKLKLKLFCLYEFFSALSIDKYVSSISSCVFTVGSDDANFYHSLYKVPAIFIPHPYNALLERIEKTRDWEADEKLKICIPGGITYFYTGDLLNKIFDNFIKQPEYAEKIEFSFLGKIRFNSLQNKIKELKNKGYMFTTQAFVDNFEGYMASQHIILLPVLVGAGTKNRCISAAAMGLDILGTPIATENVYGIQTENIAINAEDFFAKIKKRLNEHRLFQVKNSQKVRENHLNILWKERFWQIVFN